MMMMSSLNIEGQRGNSTIWVGKSLRDLKAYAWFKRCVIITDSNVRRLYAQDFPSSNVIEIGSGERIKTLHTVNEIYLSLLKFDIDRSSFIIGIGGGVVCDTAGFVASTYLRGLRFGLVPSTLLAQVDAGIGGKNGVNLNGYKNLIGVFSQPDFVLCDIDLLNTLPKRELLVGFSEILKHAAIADPELFLYLEQNHEKALGLNRPVIERLVGDSLKIKAAIVNKDETEKGERRKLNFGHTFGHAIERVTGISHGEAVSAGMVMAALLSEKMGYLRRRSVEKIETLLLNLGLPTRMALNRKAVLNVVGKDKKWSGEKIHFVFLTDIGHAIVEEMGQTELERLTDEIDWPWR